MTVDVGDSILMECVARGFPIPRIRWFRNNKALPNNGSVIEITKLSLNHTGVYRCVAENVAGNATATATLSVMGESCNCRKRPFSATVKSFAYGR